MALRDQNKPRKMIFQKLTAKTPQTARQCLICNRRNVRKGAVVSDPEDEVLDAKGVAHHGGSIYDLVYCWWCVRNLLRALA